MQEVVVRCGGHVLITRLEFDLFAGGTLVVGVLTAPERLKREWSPPVPDDQHYNVVFGYDSGRRALRDKWLKLPNQVRVHVKSAYLILFRPASGKRIGMQDGFLEFR